MSFTRPINRPKRIQRQRTAGWCMPEGAIYVGRPTKWGNPYGRKIDPRDNLWCSTPESQVEIFRDLWAPARIADTPGWLDPLRGRDLACWCPLDQPCHADVLLELANRGGAGMNEHHVETYMTDDFQIFGWQCFTCKKDADGFEDFNAADAAADLHRVDAGEGQ